MTRIEEQAGPHDSVSYEAVWRAQWETLRAWISARQALGRGDQPSVLDGWTIRDLIAHLGPAFNAATNAEETDESPRTLRQYVAGYRDAVVDIDRKTRAASSERGDLLAWLDETAAAAFAAVAARPGTVVRGRRGPISRDDFVVTRILELVVHGDDLARSMPDADGSPLDDRAVAIVARALADGYEEVAGRRPASEDGIAWIRAAAGRVASADPHLPLL